MNTNVKLMLTIGVLALCGGAGVDAAHAQNQSYVDPSVLPRGDKPYVHRRKIQIVNENPEITSVPPGPEARKMMVIMAPQQQAPATEIIYVNAPGVGGGGLPAGVVDLSGPPRSGFGQSNIPSGGPLSMRNKLPAGQTSNGLFNQSQHLKGKLTPGTVSRPSAGTASPGLLNKTANSAPAAPLTYDRSGTGSGGSTAVTTKTEVVGKLQRRSLLDKTDK